MDIGGSDEDDNDDNDEDSKCEEKGGDERTEREKMGCSTSSCFIAEIFPVNKPPPKKQRTSADQTGEPPNKAKLVDKKHGKRAAASSASYSYSSVSTADARPHADQSSAPDAARKLEKLIPEPDNGELLNRGNVPDVDELYSENERALTNFIRLHPMLRSIHSMSRAKHTCTHTHMHFLHTHPHPPKPVRSLDATSERTLSMAASLVDKYALPTRELETVSKTHDDLFFRRANTEVGERPCVNGEKCICRWLAIFRYGEETDAAFVGREFLLPSQLDDFQQSGRLPKAQAKCLMCTRYFTSYVYTLARNSPSFSPKSCIAVQAFGNKIGVHNVEEETMTHSNSVGCEDGYRADVMLYVDEKWADTASSRGPLGTLLWRPVVRFQSSDYVYVKNKTSGLYEILQVNLGVKTDASDFGQPPSSVTERVEA